MGNASKSAGSGFEKGLEELKVQKCLITLKIACFRCF
jgi:hypothetical protein